eukprot:TRINITY_DN2923_c1_g1_i2.p1 TRINITY_DN2923_c1_g1~~TRINITY_DN2923_c1_g1_i2.p1  ORF type:complete len:280 (+),score=90.65 TRINITY_DN2923_c1_g1_i2:27-842(+)
MSNPDVAPLSLEESISQLTDRMNECEKNGDYIEAQVAKRRLDSLKAKESSKNRQILADKQKIEADDLHDTQLRIKDEFNTKWDEDFRQFETNTESMKRELIEKHETERRALIEDFEKDRPKIKPSAEYLNLKRIESMLATQKRFKEAHNAKVKAEAKLEQEENAHIARMENLLKIKMKQLIKKQKVEFDAKVQKAFLQKSELTKNKNKELNRLKLKFKNETTTLRNKHTSEQKDIGFNQTKMLSPNQTNGNASASARRPVSPYTKSNSMNM